MGELGAMVGSSSEAQDSGRARPPEPRDLALKKEELHQDDFEDEVLSLRKTKSH